MTRCLSRPGPALRVLAGPVLLFFVQIAAAEEPVFRDLARKYFKDGEGAELAKLVGFTQPVKQVIALSYRVLLFENGKEQAVDPKTHEFRVGDKIRITVEPLHDYCVYVFTIGASGQSGFLMPAEGEEAPLAKANTPLALPNDGFFEFSEPPGEEQLLVVATEKPVADRNVLARVLSKKPGEPDTPEEAEVRKTLKATVRKALKSVRERQKEVMDGTVMWRGLTGEKAQEELAQDVRTRGVKDGTFEEPTAHGTTAMYINSTELDAQARLLVSIPLKSVGAAKAKP
jgi:hypothetical protein